MRTAEIELEGVRYPLCYSTRVVRAAVETFGTMEEFGRQIFALPGEDEETGDERKKAGGVMETLPARVWLLAREMDAGARYARLNGRESPKPLTEEELWDLVGGENCAVILQKALDTMLLGNETSTEAESEKNGEASR